MNENRDDLAASVKRNADEFTELMSEDLINALAEAAKDDEAWLEAARDVRGFLREKGIEVPDRGVVRVETVVPDAGGSEDASGGLQRPRWLGQCPPGYLPVVTPQIVCTKQAQLCVVDPDIGYWCTTICFDEDILLIRRCRAVRDLGPAHLPLTELSLPDVYPGPSGGREAGR